MGNADSTQMEKVNEVLKASKKLTLSTKGDIDSFDFRVQTHDIRSDGELNVLHSMWHDVKLYPTEGSRAHNVVNMVNEIPRCSRKKYEIATNEVGNPIKQDVKKGKLREFSKGDLYFNYGCLPRTWEDPDVEHPDAMARGDNDPLDVCEIGLRILGLAEIVPVKILGTLCLIDEGEADWKMIAIAITDPWAAILNDVTDLEAKLPGTVDAIREWFRTYKIPDGKPENKFGLKGKCMDAAYAMKVIDETHHAWRSLVLGEKDVMPATDGSKTDTGIKRNLSYPKLNLEDLNLMDA